jgi:CheY-like chemotaxis protein
MEPTIMSQTKPAPREGEAGSLKMLVFVVDDNELLVEFAATVLESAGYRVKKFCHPLDALKTLKEGEAKPALLVTDYDMNEMNGLELIVNCHQLHPTLKTILLSGTIDGSLASLHPARVHRFLGKPYQPAQLKTLVAELLRV